MKSTKKITILLTLFTFSLIVVNTTRIENHLTSTAPKNIPFFIHTSWDGGNGTIGNPYILENKTYDGGTTNGYSLINFNSYFIIRNCTFINSGTADDNAGLRLLGVENGLIYNNTFESCQNGILFSQQVGTCQNNIVMNNTFRNNINGIRVAYLARLINITENRFFNNIDGIELFGRDLNSVYYNFFESNGVGIHLVGSDSNDIVGNYVRYSTNYGIYLENSDTNKIRDNTIRNNVIGVLLDNSKSNDIYLNVFISNTEGITFQAISDDNTIYINTFYGNNDHISLTNSFGNTFHNGSIGNDWDDYDGYDCNGDGIGETPYEEGTISDPFPICNLPDIYDPIVFLIDLTDGQVIGTAAPSFTLSIQEYLVDSTYYQIDGGSDHNCEASDTIDQLLWDSLPDGRHNITFSVYDVAGNIGVVEVYIFKDTTEEPAIPFGHYFLLIMITSIMVILLYFKRKISIYV